MPNADLNEETLIEETLSSLGSSGVDVEVGPADVLVAVRQTLRTYNRYCPRQGRARLAVTKAQKKYGPIQTALGIPQGFKGVTSVEFITRRIDPAAVDPFDPYVTSQVGPNYGDETFADIHLRRSYAEDAARIISSETEWHAQWEGSDYYLYVDVVRDSVECGYTYTHSYLDTDADRQLIPDGDVQWFMDMTLARTKRILVRIRGKHQGITNAEGSTDPMDHSEMAQEAQEEMQRLEEEIRLRRPPFLPVLE